MIKFVLVVSYLFPITTIATRCLGRMVTIVVKLKEGEHRERERERLTCVVDE